MTRWPSGLRRWSKVPVRKGVGSNPTLVRIEGFLLHVIKTAAIAQWDSGGRLWDSNVHQLVARSLTRVVCS